MRLMLEELVDSMGGVLAEAGVGPRIAIPPGIDARAFRVRTLAEWLVGWLDRHRAACDGAPEPWAEAIRRVEAKAMRDAISTGVVRQKEWRACISRALRACGHPGASNEEIEAAMKAFRASGRHVPLMRGEGGRLMPDWRALRDSGVFGKRVRPSRAKLRAPGSTSAPDPLEAAGNAEARTVARVAIIEAIEKLERTGALAGKPAEMVRRSLDLGLLDHSEWGSRPHHEALVRAGVSWTALRTTQRTAVRAWEVLFPRAG